LSPIAAAGRRLWGLNERLWDLTRTLSRDGRRRAECNQRRAVTWSKSDTGTKLSHRCGDRLRHRRCGQVVVSATARMEPSRESASVSSSCRVSNLVANGDSLISGFAVVSPTWRRDPSLFVANLQGLPGRI